jgi:hypothetical protein
MLPNISLTELCFGKGQYHLDRKIHKLFFCTLKLRLLAEYFHSIKELFQNYKKLPSKYPVVTIKIKLI